MSIKILEELEVKLKDSRKCDENHKLFRKIVDT